VPERVLGDPHRIRQCLLNLVGNAIKFTHRGEVVIDVSLAGERDGRALVDFSVRDTGIGIAPQVLDRLFLPFTQADSSTTRRFGGTGLGLSIVRKLVEMMGGEVSASSEQGRGSTFRFTIPLQVVATQSDSRPHATRQGRVLVVDDNETSRQAIAARLSAAGFEVAAAADAPHALDLLQNARFDVALLDYQMPQVDGVALGGQIKTSHANPPRLVLLTELDRSSEMDRIAALGFSAYLTKPIRHDELLDCLDRVLAKTPIEWHMRTQPIDLSRARTTNEARPQYGARVLLVEDNAINQRVAQRFLELLGCTTETASDGSQGVEAFARGGYQFVLMDMQMPVMDGLEATRRIRAQERGGSRVPIVALTADAMVGTLEQCLDAGMDGYLTKPLELSRLQDVLAKFLGVVPAVAVAKAAATDDAMRARLSELSGEDPEFTGELIAAFILGGEETLSEMRAAVASGDVDMLGRCAHKLKGASDNLHVTALAAIAHDMEMRARSGSASDWRQDVERMSAEFNRVAEGLRAEAALPRRAAS
jgi:CheY-like chemotaxis protein/HPt (histidine-containing phosphotransfer) domain-containing protein